MTQFKATYQSPLGPIVMLADEQYLLGVWFDQQTYFGAKYDLNAASIDASPILSETTTWLDDYFAGKRPDPALLPTHPETTQFRREVYQVLLSIPYGKTITYQEIVAKLTTKNGQPTGSARAVGGAVGHNPISIVIPCHRVLGANGSLTGYAGGLDRKKALLKLEAN